MMKKLILTLYFVAATILMVNAQISVTPKVVEGWGPNQKDKKLSSVFRNESTDPTDNKFTWRFLEYNLPSSWKIQICDPQNCIDSSLTNASSYADFTCNSGDFGTFLLDFYYYDTEGQGTIKVIVQSKKNSSYVDTVTFNTTAWVTGVKEVNKASKITVYPNPVKNNMFISTKEVDANSVVKVYDLTGKEVMSVNLKGRMETEVDCSGLSNGMYIAKFTVNGKTAVQRISISR